MKIVVDTNVLVRFVVGDDDRQAKAAVMALENAEIVAIGAHALCELVWVLNRSYGVARQDIVETIRKLTSARNVEVDRLAVEAGLAMLEAGGDFADGIIAHEGHWLGGETFLSFDKQAVKLLVKQGRTASLL
ncbi:MAG: type II toxin-antitoxin system VapC family toxin [Gammaproteobacteria bacterium]|nr:type II toxin-antitoxin system VapC family toxin [Gammaproteobacteria bacterium]